MVMMMVVVVVEVVVVVGEPDEPGHISYND